MVRFANCNNKGMTLLELLLSIILLSVVSMALMKTTMIGIQQNMKNALRDEAVGIAEQQMNVLRNIKNEDLFSIPTSTSIPRNFRRGQAPVIFNVKTTPKSIDGNDTVQITVDVTWNYNRANFSHSVTSIKRDKL